MFSDPLTLRLLLVGRDKRVVTMEMINRRGKQCKCPQVMLQTNYVTVIIG